MSDSAAQLLPDRVGKDGNGGNRGKEQGAARRQQERQPADRHQKQEAETAGHPAAGMEQQYQHQHVDRRLQHGLHARARQPPAHQNHAAEAETQIKYRCAEEKPRGINRKAAGAAQRIQTEQQQRHRDSIQIEDTEHAPIECGT